MLKDTVHVFAANSRSPGFDEPANFRCIFIVVLTLCRAHALFSDAFFYDYGFVLAISGMTSPLRLGCSSRWYLVRPSRRNSKPSSGELTKRKRSTSPGAITPASAMALKLRMLFQYSPP